MNIVFPPEMVTRVLDAMNKAANEVATEVGSVLAPIVAAGILGVVLKLIEDEKYDVMVGAGGGETCLDYDSLKTKLEEIAKDPMKHLELQAAEVKEKATSESSQQTQ